LPGARLDLAEALTYFDERSLDVGNRFVHAFEAGLRRIRQFPEIGSPMGRRVRKFVLATFSYSIIYVRADDEIIVVAVAAHARRSGYWRRRLQTLR